MHKPEHQQAIDKLRSTLRGIEFFAVVRDGDTAISDRVKVPGVVTLAEFTSENSWLCYEREDGDWILRDKLHQPGRPRLWPGATVVCPIPDPKPM